MTMLSILNIGMCYYSLNSSESRVSDSRVIPKGTIESKWGK